MRHTAARQGSAAGEFRNIFHVRRAHAALVIDAHIFKELVERHILLRVGMQQIMKLQASDSQDRLTVHLGIVEAV